jgi:hypothetical protein
MLKKLGLFLVLTFLWLVPAQAADRFWVCGTGTWNVSSSGCWSATSGGAGGETVPGASDVAIFDANSGGGTVTTDINPSLQGLTLGQFTGTLTWATNNNSPSIGSAGLNNSGTGTRTFNMGNGTWTFTGTSGTVFDQTDTTNLTFNANSSTLVLSGNGDVTFAGGGQTFNVVQKTVGGGLTITGANTFATLSIATGIRAMYLPGSTTTTITNAPTWVGTSTAQLLISSSLPDANAVLSIASGTMSMQWAAIRRMTFQDGATFTATNSFDAGGNSGATITMPATGGPNFIGGGG